MKEPPSCPGANRNVNLGVGTEPVFEKATDASTNRLPLAGTLYHVAGNITRLSMGGEVLRYDHDGVSMMRSLISNTDQARSFLYDAVTNASLCSNA